MHPDQAVVAGADRVGSENPQADRVFAAADVRDERAAPRHVVIERREHLEGRVEHAGPVPLVDHDQRVTPRHLVVVDAGEVHRGPVAGAERVVGFAE